MKNILFFFQKNHRTSPTVTQLNRRRLIGELLYILRPMVNLTTGAIVGGLDHLWTPYLVSLGLDLFSLRLLQGDNFLKNNVLDRNNIFRVVDLLASQNKHDDIDDIWNWSEKIEIQRRYLSLFMYLLRSPFYDQHTKQRLIRILSIFADYIPIFGRIIRPFILYLPEWQQIYFNVWG